MRTRAVIPGLFVLALLSAEARGQSPGEAPPTRRSRAIALLLSLGATAAGAAVTTVAYATGSEELSVVGFGGLLVGPSVGRWYAGNKTGIGLAARGVAGAVMLVAMVASDEEGCDDDHGEDCPDRPADGGWKPVFYSGAALWVGSSLYDIVRAPLDAGEFNRAHELAVVPTAVPGGAGLALSGSF